MWNNSVVSNVRNEPRSYLVRNVHRVLRRNRRHLYKINLKPVFHKCHHHIAIKVMDLCKAQMLYIIQLICQYLVVLLDCRISPLNHRTDQNLAMDGRSDFLPSIEILWYPDCTRDNRLLTLL